MTPSKLAIAADAGRGQWAFCGHSRPARIPRRRGRDLSKDVQSAALQSPGYGSTARTSSRSSPSTSAACSPSASSCASTAPFHATSDPALAQQRRRVLAQHRQRAERPRGHHVERRLVQFLRPRARDAHVLHAQFLRRCAPSHAHFFPTLSTSTTSASGRAIARTRPGQARAGAEVGDPPRFAHRGDIEPDERVGDVHALRLPAVVDRGRGGGVREARRGGVSRDLRSGDRHHVKRQSSGATTRWRSGSVPSE